VDSGWILGKETEGVDWMHLARDKYQWQALMNTIMNIWIAKKAGNFLTR
jgi:hypothetical protein